MHWKYFKHIHAIILLHLYGLDIFLLKMSWRDLSISEAILSLEGYRNRQSRHRIGVSLLLVYLHLAFSTPELVVVTRVQNLGKLRVYLSISVSKGLSTKLGMFFSALPWPAERRFESIKISLVLWERSGQR